MVATPPELQPEGINPLEPELKPRSLRFGEIAWDLMPLILIFGWLFIEASNPVIPPVQSNLFIGIPMALAFSVSIANALWMQFSAFALIRRLTQLEWRESLYLSEIKARPYLVSQLGFRAKLQVIPFAVGMFCCTLAAGLGFQAGVEENWRDSTVILGTGLIYALLCMQFCGVCTGLLGHLNRIRLLCKPHASEVSLIFISAQWIAIILITPATLIIGGTFVLDWAMELVSEDSDPVRGENYLFSAVTIYLFIMCTSLSLFFYWRLKRSWRKTQEAFYLFE